MQESPTRSTSNVSKFKRYISVKNNDNHANYEALKKSGMWTSKNPLTICQGEFTSTMGHSCSRIPKFGPFLKVYLIKLLNDFFFNGES